jgi:hypothetical protein
VPGGARTYNPEMPSDVDRTLAELQAAAGA